MRKIDQSEFEGFEYINPLLMSAEECVWAVFFNCILLMLPFNTWKNWLPPWIQLTISYLLSTEKFTILYYRVEESSITSKFNYKKEIKISCQTITLKFSYAGSSGLLTEKKDTCLFKGNTTALKEKVCCFKAHEENIVSVLWFLSFCVKSFEGLILE